MQVTYYSRHMPERLSLCARGAFRLSGNIQHLSNLIDIGGTYVLPISWYILRHAH